MNILLLLYFLTSLLIPAFIFNKIIFVLMTFIFIINNKIIHLKCITISPFVITCIFLFGFLISLLTYSDRSIGRQFLLSISILYLIYPIIYYKLDIELIIKISGIVISIITILIYIEIFIIRKPSLGVLFLQLVDGWAQERSFSEDNSHIVFGLRTVAFLYLPLILFFQSFLNTKKIGDIFGLLLVGITILMNLSRGLILVSILGLVVIIYNKLRLMGRILLSIVLLISSFVILGYFLEKTQVFDVNETSNSVKIGHFLSFIDNLNIRNIFIGDGLGAYYYSKGSQAVKSYSELQPIDMLRYFGFILMPLLYFFMLFPIRKIKRNSKMSKLYCILFSIYILYSFTNPVMFHSYGLTIVVWYWSMIINEARSWN